ncbi:RloB family protein [Streptomyces sp. SL13]|uniref:RloB family protein n=1 Tax=Streptantibioticus silvisoli TaxID=2705255 RepID=A0AA90KES3_9ACTN|nr:RloB family protein [Streptantibioticus silvisoli]MDI5968340.1 RloB family protein [Streptantibioticus silvisoli]
MVCGAEVTERDYLNGLRTVARNQAVSVKIVERPKSPSQVVDYARTLQDRDPGAFDQTWCVLDVDDFDDIPQAVAAAGRGHRIRIALSNPCFELWLLLHHVDHRAFAPDCDHLKPLLDKHLPGGYSKTGLNFRHFAGGWQDAVGRAKALAPFGEELRHNPSTGVWRLAQEISGQPSDGR